MVPEAGVRPGGRAKAGENLRAASQSGQLAGWPGGRQLAGRLAGEDPRTPGTVCFCKIEPARSTCWTLSSNPDFFDPGLLVPGLARLVVVSLEGEGERRRLADRCQ